MKKPVAVVALAVALACCKSVTRAMTYDGVPVERFDHEGENWRIFDDTERSRMMTSPSIGTGASAGFASGLTLGLVNAMPDGLQHRNMVVAYMKVTGRSDCVIAEEGKAIKGQYCNDHFKDRC